MASLQEAPPIAANLWPLHQQKQRSYQHSTGKARVHSQLHCPAQPGAGASSREHCCKQVPDAAFQL